MRHERVLILIGTVAIGLAAPAAGQRAALAMLDQVQPGAWELRVREAGAGPNRLCIGDARRFIQLRHPDTPCERIVIEDRSDMVTVQYTCHGRGYGRTTIRRENAQLVQIATQGIAQGLPFEFSAEARRVGTCAT